MQIKSLTLQAPCGKPSFILSGEFSQESNIHKQLADNWHVSFPNTPVGKHAILLPSYVVYIELDGIVVSQAIVTPIIVIPPEFAIKYENSPVFSIASVCTRPEYRKNGYCIFLMKAIIKLAKLFNRNLILDVNVGDTIAYNIYTKLGFEEIGIDTRKEPHGIIMELSIQKILLANFLD